MEISQNNLLKKHYALKIKKFNRYLSIEFLLRQRKFRDTLSEVDI